MFHQPVDEIARDVLAKNQIFVAFEDLPVPSVVAINGVALGGGLELALAASLRVMSTAAQVGVPEVALGLFPGFGGTVRLARVAGAANAIAWVAGAKPARARAALDAGVVDEVCEPADLRATALALLHRAAAGAVDWRAAQERKRRPLPQPEADLSTVFEVALADVRRRSPRHQPAAAMAVETMARGASRTRADALELEAGAFARCARTQAAGSLVQAFLNERALKKLCRAHARDARTIRQAAVLGAGIMGGGIAFASALRGTPVRLKDITPAQLDLGMSEAARQFAKMVKSGRLAQPTADALLATLHPQLGDTGFEQVDLVIEAVVENIDVKRRVLAALEGVVRDDTVIASNTSSLRIDDIAAPLARPANVVGMHFFNPVPVMPLVEVIRGSATSDATVATAVGHAVAMGKTPVVVKDCPGFLVNRIVTPYVNAFLQLVCDGADFVEVDRAMEAFGWPMGPAYLQDVVGMDTAAHVGDVIAAGYAQRMRPVALNAVKLMVERKRYGQKTGLGFYRYEADAAGKPKKSVAADSHDLLALVQPRGRRSFADDEIVERLMLPLIIEAAHALEEGIVGTPAELDMALMLGIGLPAYLGGALKYADWLGLRQVVSLGEKYAALGPAYVPTPRMNDMAAQGLAYYPI
jgi:3-hydroxyacyl-CoA dehydrogenase/enoyl-CoA hydratase/3-hydroxybutyryl-CoA epimerase/enoyl-CoA isomerase